MAQFQMLVTRRPEGPLGQRWYPVFPAAFDLAGFSMTEAVELASMNCATLPPA